jgi:nitrogenase subunit NifH
MGKKIIAEDYIRFKWLADGCKTWDDIVIALSNKSDDIKYLKNIGSKIIQNEDDYLYFDIPEDKIKEYCKRFGMKEEDLHTDDEQC